MEDFEDENNPWLSFSDLLAGVMLVFCIICVDFIQKLDKTNNTKAAVFAKISKELKQAGINPKVNPENGTVEISSNIVFDTNSSKLKIDGIDYLSKIVPILSRSIFTVPAFIFRVKVRSLIGSSSFLILTSVFKSISKVLFFLVMFLVLRK